MEVIIEENKKNLFKKIIENIKRVWIRLGEPEIVDYTDVDKGTAQEVKEVERVQEEVREEHGGPGRFVPKAEIDEIMAARIAEEEAKKGNKSPKTITND